MMPTTALPTRLHRADLLKAHVALLEHVMIRSEQIDLYRLVSHHYRALQAWHLEHTGWRILRAEGIYRLARVETRMTPGVTFDPLRDARDYACLTWILWFAENRHQTGRGRDQQFLLSDLTRQVAEQAALMLPGAHPIDFLRITDRYSMQRALKYLQQLGAIQSVQGESQRWVAQSDGSDVLYEFTPTARALVAANDVARIAAVGERLHDPAQGTQPAFIPAPERVEAVPPLTRGWRALLSGPALFRFDDPAAFAAVVAEADQIAEEIAQRFGWLCEITRSYACIVRAMGTPAGPEVALSRTGAVGHVVLLLCNALRERVQAHTLPAPDEYECLHLRGEDMAAIFYDLRERYGQHWGSTARGRTSADLLTEVYQKMRQIGFLRGPDHAGNIIVLPLAARYQVVYVASRDEDGHDTGDHAPEWAIE